jgi:hypothetical protein
MEKVSKFFDMFSQHLVHDRMVMLELLTGRLNVDATRTLHLAEDAYTIITTRQNGNHYLQEQINLFTTELELFITHPDRRKKNTIQGIHDFVATLDRTMTEESRSGIYSNPWSGYEDNVMAYEESRFKPVGPGGLIALSTTLNNCVSRHCYAQDVRDGRTAIFSMRLNGADYVCIEVKLNHAHKWHAEPRNAIVQAKLNRNQPARNNRIAANRILAWAIRNDIDISTYDLPDRLVKPEDFEKLSATEAMFGEDIPF